jgi:hypothetical protein
LASYNEHLKQANNNLAFLAQTNTAIAGFWDWQVTISFYVAVHVINAHLAKIANLHYRTHEDVKNAISPYSVVSPAKIPENIYLSYAKLESLSRRARYLCHDDYHNREERAFFIYDKHLAKAVINLDKILLHFSNEFGESFGSPTVKCVELSAKNNLKVFTLV